MIALALLGCPSEPPPPPVDRGLPIPVLDLDTKAPSAELVGWVRSQDPDGRSRYSELTSGRTALYRDGSLDSAAVELDLARCAGAVVALDTLGKVHEQQCDDRRWPLDGGYVTYLALEPQGGCVVSWERADTALSVRALGGMADFRGVAWGAPRAEIAGLVPVEGDATRAVRPTDALDWGGVPLAAVRYRFDEDRMWAVELVPAEGEKQAFLDAWTAVFGPGGDGWWHGCTVNASFELADPGTFAIRSKRITWERSQRGPGATLGQ